MPAFVCRDDALAVVTGALERPATLVLVEGEAGIGKSRLVRECLWSGEWPERIVLAADCLPLAEPAPLGPVVDGFRRLREQIGGVELSPLGGALRPLFPEWATDLPPRPDPLDDVAAIRHRVYRALAELTDRLGVGAVVVEDAHWADTATLEWLLVASKSWGDRRSVVVTYRSEEVPSGSLLRQLAGRIPSGMAKVPIALEPLDVTGIAELTGSMFGTPEVSYEFAEFLHERTGGLPLAVEECLKLMRDRGDIMRKEGQWGRKALGQIQVPPNLRDSVLERVDRLSPDTRRVLEAAAVLGEPAEEALLAAVAGLGPEAAGSAVAAACVAGLLGGAGLGRVAFRHQLAAEAVEETIPASEHRKVHQRAGEVLRDTGELSVDRLSRHFKQAGDVESWARYAEAAADRALESGDDHTAVTVLHDLLTTVEHPGERRARLARKLGERRPVGLPGWLTGPGR